MKFSIGLRLFIAVLIASFGVAALGLVLINKKISESFSDYAIQIELDRLQQISESLQQRYAQHQNWSFIPAEAQKKQDWVSAELLRLHEKRMESDIAALPAAKPAPRVTVVKSVRAVPDGAIDVMLPPLPPMPPPPPEPPIAEAPPLPSLYQRISLLDAQRAYLAGRLPDNAVAVSRAIYSGDRLIGYLQVAKSDQPTDALARAFLQKQTDMILLLVLVSVGLSALAATLLAMHFRRPILRLVQGSRQLADGRFDTRLDAGRSDELGELALSFNQLAEKLEKAEQSRRQWVADTSHELRTPISVLRAQLEAMQDGVRQANPENIALMLRQILSLNKLIDELYALARADVGELSYHMQNLDLWALAKEEGRHFQEKMDANQLHLIFAEAPVQSMVSGDPDRLRQVVSNLLENCLRYTDHGGTVMLSAQAQNACLTLTLDDSAPAVPDEALTKLGERFYRVDPSRSRQKGGAGLGLALCGRIIEAHHGSMRFAHSPSGGLRVQILLPLLVSEKQKEART